MNNLSNWIRQKRVCVLFLIGAMISSANAYYQPESGRFMQRDPLGVKPLEWNKNLYTGSQYLDGMNLYQYVKNNPSRYIDFDGLRPANPGDIEGGEYPPLPPPWVPSDDPEDESAFIGGEINMIIGAGVVVVKCNNECNIPKKYIYQKSCIGAALGAALSVGVVGGLNGKDCRPENYAGWFVEGGVTAGILGLGLDIGFDKSPIWLPNPIDPSGVHEVGGGLSPGWQGKLSLCYYTQVGGDDYVAPPMGSIHYHPY
jgi:RHS repeat-associated protein